MSRLRRLAGFALLSGMLAPGSGDAAELPPSAFSLLQPRALEPGFLDAAPVCLPPPQAAREQAAEASAPSLEFAIRTSRESSQPAAAEERLEQALRGDPDAAPALRSCARLELARLALKRRRVPEARAELLRAEREGSSPSQAVAAIADFYRAETLTLAGAGDEAAPLYASLRDSEPADLARVAELRALRRDLAGADAEAARAAAKRLETSLQAARDAGLDVSEWAALAGEVAIDLGELRRAHRWLAVAERIEDGAGVAAIRKADVLVALDRAQDARGVLDRVARRATLPEARDLARVRLAALVVPATVEQRAAVLERASHSRNPSVSAQARDALAALLLEAGDLRGALEVLSQLGHDGAPAFAKPRFSATLRATLRAATAPEFACTAVLEAAGGRRQLFLRLTPEPEPALRIGDCFLELGMPEAASELYRGLARRFPLAPNQLALRIAKTSFALGNLAALRAALRARRADDGGEEASWRWLEARLARVEGRVADAERALIELLGRGDLPDSLRVEAERQLVSLEGPDLDDDARREVLLRSLAEPAASTRPEARADTWLLTADLLAGAGAERPARAAYRRAEALLQPGSRRARAGFAAAQRAPSEAGVRESLTALDNPEHLPWMRLAQLELRLISLRAASRGSRTP